MSLAFKQVIENIKELTQGERAMIAHCLISSLDSSQNDSVDYEWSKLSEKRLLDLETGVVKGISWENVKSKVKG